MNLREIEDAGQRFLEAKGHANGESADAPDQVLYDQDLDELEACCWSCVVESGGTIDPLCGRCGGTGRIDAPNHPNWCHACGMTGKCPDCDGDAYDRANDR